VVKALRHFRVYLYGRKFTIRTDHLSLRWLLNFREPRDQLARWMHELSPYQNQYTIEHRPGTKHGNGDGLSRRPCRQCKREDCASARFAGADGGRVRLVQAQPHWSFEELKTAQEKDESVNLIREAVLANQKPPQEVTAAWPRAARRYLADWDRLEVRQGVLWREWYDDNGDLKYQQFVVPKSMRKDVFRRAHDNPIAGHFGKVRTIERIREVGH
jgi:hypothetical protein